MADDVILPGTGAEIRTVEIGGVQVQFVFVQERQVPLSFATASVTTSASLPSVHANAEVATITVEGGSIRYRPDGASTAPTSSVGMLVPSGATVQLPFGHAGLVATRIISASGSPVVSVVYS